MKQDRVISRRTLLKGAGAALALPLLEAMMPFRALATTPAARPPVRFGIFSVTGGTVLEAWTPREVGRLTRLPSILRPLEFARDELLVVSGLCQGGRSEGLNAHEACSFLHLTGAPLVKREGGRVYAGVSVDQAAARVLGRDTLLPSLEVGLVPAHYSFRSDTVPLPFEANPRLVFDRMFRGRRPVVPNWRRRAAAPAESAAARGDSDDQGVIDLVLEQTRDLRRDLGNGDRRRLDEYLESVRSVERRLAFVEARHRQDLRDLADPGPSRLNIPANLPPEGTPEWRITRPIYEDPDKHGDYIRLMADLMVLAFQTDTTRVMTVAAGSDECLFHGVVTVGRERHCHTLEHNGNSGRLEDCDPIAREGLRQIHTWYSTLFAEMVRKMRAIDEGGSSLLDNSVILYTSYMADGGHGTHNYPVLLAGRAGGRLRPGRHLDFPRKAPVANLYVELLNLLGVPTRTFGESATSRFARDYASRLPGLV